MGVAVVDPGDLLDFGAGRGGYGAVVGEEVADDGKARFVSGGRAEDPEELEVTWRNGNAEFFGDLAAGGIGGRFAGLGLAAGELEERGAALAAAEDAARVVSKDDGGDGDYV